MVEEFRSDGSVYLARDYAATPDEVWDAWTSPERLARWLGTPSGPLLGAAAPVRLDLGDGQDDWADVSVISAERPRLLELTWSFVGEPGSVLRVEIVPIDATHTRVLVEHRGLGTSAVGYGAGWQAYLDGGLAADLGEGIEGADWDERFQLALPGWRDRAAAAQGTSSATG